MKFLIQSALFAASLRSASAFVSSPKVAATFAHRSMTTLNAKPFAVVVNAEIQPDRMDEFMKLIEENAISTRKEPGCLRFDVLRSQDKPTQFFFYELYENTAAIDYHKQQPHYNLWSDFKASGGVVDSTSYKTDGEFMTEERARK